LSLFGYNPIKYQVGRGVLAAMGINFELDFNDVAARGNFSTIDSDNKVTDRRAGRISTEKNKELCYILQDIDLPDAQVFVEPVKEHRFLLVIRAKELGDRIHDTDPQSTGVEPYPAKAQNSESDKTAKLVNEFINKAREKLAEHHPANMVLLRGFSKKPNWPSMKDVFGLKPAAIAGYPMYRGVSKLVGMDVLETGDNLDDEFDTLRSNWQAYDFFYVHVKKTDSSGEDGDIKRKSRVIEEVDQKIPQLLKLKPDVIVVTGDHSTPAILKSHSWHPVPVALWSHYCRADSVGRFNEMDCIRGGLGPRFPATHLLPLALANADRLDKFGA
jgi:2,3-bisphosphoglycerate-independent phosphoglycerate mutase